MQRDLVRDGLRFKLAEQYRENPARFLSLSKEAIDSALGREIVAELRNEGHVEEEVRGTIRLTPRGYMEFQNDPPPYSYIETEKREGRFRRKCPKYSKPLSGEPRCGE